MTVKLNKANDMLSKLRQVLDTKTLKTVFYAIFESRLCYASLVSLQNYNSSKTFFVIKKIPQDDVLSGKKFPHRSFIERLQIS